MAYHGHVENGVVVLDEPAALPEGMKVAVEPLDEGTRPTLADRFKDVIGSVDDLPADMAEQHDHYIHGTPKK